MSFTPVAIRARDSTESTTSQHESKVTICLEQKFYTAPAQNFFLSRSLLEMSEKRNPDVPIPDPYDSRRMLGGFSDTLAVAHPDAFSLEIFFVCLWVLRL